MHDIGFMHPIEQIVNEILFIVKIFLYPQKMDELTSHIANRAWKEVRKSNQINASTKLKKVA